MSRRIRSRTRGPSHRVWSPPHAMTVHAPTARRRDDTPAEALATFIRVGRRDTLIGDLTRKWHALGRSEVEDAVDAAIADATAGMRATHEAGIYEYLRTAAQRKLGRRKKRAGRIADSHSPDSDFDRLVSAELSPEDAT